VAVLDGPVEVNALIDNHLRRTVVAGELTDWLVVAGRAPRDGDSR
jgi:hypothetical protein